MWNRAKNTGPATNRRSFSIVHQYIQRFNEVSGNKSAVIRRRTKTGVMITQNVTNIPEGKSTPDFQCKPTAVATKEGKLAVFKAVVKGDPKPEVSWRRAKGTMSDKDKFKSKYDESTGEHILEIHKVSAAEADTYKCCAANEYGKAVCTATLTVTQGLTDPSDFRKLLRRSKAEENQTKQADGETDKRFWDAMLNADRRDYEHICAEFGVADLDSVLKKLEVKKRERGQNKCKDGVIPYDEDETETHSLRSAGRTKDSSTKGLMQTNTGLNQVDVDEVNLLNNRLNQGDEEDNLLTEYTLSEVDFVIRIQEVKAQEREDALFACVLTHPLPRITWMGKGSALENGEKYSITVSDHKLIHRLLIKDCKRQDKGIYSAVAGITSCSAWLVVDAESDPASAGKKIARKTNLAGGARTDLEKVAREQQIKNKQEMENILASIKAKPGEGQLGDGKTPSGRQPTGSQVTATIKNSRGDGTGTTLDDSGCVRKGEVGLTGDDPKNKKHTRSGQADYDKVTDTNEEEYIEENEDFTGSTNNSRYIKSGRKTQRGETELNQRQKLATNQNEVTDSGGSKDSTGSVRHQKHKKKVHWKQNASDPNELASDDEALDSEEGDGDENEDSTGQVKRSTGSKQRKQQQRAINDPNGLASDNDANDGDENEDSTGQAKCSSGSKKSKQRQRAVNDPNELAKDTDANDGDENEDSTGQVKHSSGSKKSKQRQRAVNDPNELASDTDAKDSDEKEDSTGQVQCSSGSEKSKLQQTAVNDPNELASDTDAKDSDEKEDSTGQVKRSSGSKKSKQRQKAVNDPNELASDIDASDNDANDGDENEDSTGQVKHSSGSKKSKKRQKAVNDPNELASDTDASDNDAKDGDENEDSTGQVKHSSGSKKSKKRQKAVNGESTGPSDHNECDETEEATGSATHSRRKRQGPLIEDMVIDPGVHFICGLSDVNAIINESAELTCKLSSEDCEGAWFRDGKKISPDDNFTITKDGAIHKLVIIRCEEEHSGKYRFEADGRKTEAMINVKDPPRFHPEDLCAFTEPVMVKVGHNAIFKLHFVGHEPIKIQWYKEGEELHDDNNMRIERSASHSRLLLTRCQRRDTGEIKIKLKNEHGFTEAISQLIVLDKPTPPLGPAEVTESSAMCIEFRWRPPKDDGGSPVINYIMERQQVGRNTWKKLGEIPGVPTYRDTDVDHGRKYCYRIQAVTAEGMSEVMETDDMQAGTLAFPGPPAPPKVDSAYDDCINISWESPSNRGGSRILGYILEKRKKGSNLWTVVNASDELIKENKCAAKDVVAGMEYEFRVTAINLSGAGEFSSPSEFVFARDPKKPPGKVTSLKVTESSYTHLVLTWTKPEDKPGIQDEAKGYFVEIRQADCIEWSRCNTTAIITTSFSVKGLKSMDMYWVRVIATNDGGESAPEELTNYVVAMPSPVRPKFTNHKMKSFMVVRAGNTVRITVNFEASPRPHIMWLKDNVPVARRVTVSNSDGSSQLLIPSSERSDSGIYSIVVKNLAGQETFSTEVRVTDDPKPPGPVELEENVPGTVTVIWEPSPDEKRDDRLHYTVSKLDSTKRTWTTVADRLFNNKFTVCNIMPGREYNFRVYARNDMGISAPSESPTWGVEKKKEKFVVSVPTRKDRDLQCAPTFIVPLKLHTAPKGYECYMSCAVKGNPKPRITWYRNHISLNTNDNYYISDTCGVCSMLILHVGPKDMGEYTISAENALGRAECSTVLSVRE